MSAVRRPYTGRERQTVLRMRRDGHSNRDIAVAIGRSTSSVAVHLHRMRLSGHEVAPATRRGDSCPYGTAHLHAEAVATLRADGVPVKVAARLLGLTPSAVAHRAHRAREVRT